MRRWTDSAGYLPHEAEAHCIGYRRGGTAGGVDLIVTISVNAETGACKCKVRWRRHRTIACAAEHLEIRVATCQVNSEITLLVFKLTEELKKAILGQS